MLSVGREFKIETANVVCQQCAWEGAGPELSSGLIRVSRSVIYLYAYRCPQCGSFAVVARRKLLAFRSRIASTARDAAHRSQPHRKGK